MSSNFFVPILAYTSSVYHSGTAQVQNKSSWNFTTIIGGREKSNEVALGEALKAIHDTLVGPYYQLQVIIITKLHHPVRLQNQYLNLKIAIRIERMKMEVFLHMHICFN